METPCSIPNQEAKHIVADDTLPYWDAGKVSHCGLCFYANYLFLIINLSSIYYGVYFKNISNEINLLKTFYLFAFLFLSFFMFMCFYIMVV